MQHCISVIGFYTDQNEITFAGTKEDIDLLARELDFNEASKTISFYVPNDSPAPYDGFLKGIRLCSAPGPLQTTIASDFLVITGSPKSRRQFAIALLQIIRESQAKKSYVEHNAKIRYYAQHPFLAPTSLLLIVNIIGCGLETNDVQIRGEKQFEWVEIEKHLLFDLPIATHSVSAPASWYCSTFPITPV
jgi:hypothetical protein